MAGSLGQHAVGTSFSTSSLVVGPINTATTGSTFVVTVNAYSGGVALSGVTDNMGNTYVEKGTGITLGSGLYQTFICENGAGGSGHQVTATFGGNNSPSVLFFELLGLTTTPYDTGAFAQGTDTVSPFTVTSNTLAQADSIAIALIGSDTGSNPATFAENSGFTIIDQASNGSQYWCSAAAYLVVSATTALTPSWTFTTGTGNAGLKIMAFAAAGGGSSIAVKRYLDRQRRR